MTTISGIPEDLLTDVSTIEQRLTDLEAAVRRTASGDLADDAVTTATIADNSITSALIQNATITGVDIANATIAGTNLINATITGTQIANATISGTHIATATITGTHIQDGTIQALDIANATITATQIANATITGTQIAAASITSNHIVDATIIGGDIALATIVAGNITSATITSVQIASATITGTNIASGTITSTNIQDATITGTDIANATITATQIQLLTITAAQIANATITGTQIASATITSTNIQDLTILAADIANTTITAGKITNNTITALQIQNNTLTATQIANNTITATQIAGLTITSSEIADLTITGAKIAAATITASKITVSSLSALSADLGTITAGTVTGATLRTAASGARVVMDTAGIRAYNASNVTQLDFDTATGNLTITGTLTTTSSVPAAAITGQITAAQFGATIGGGNTLTNSAFEHATPLTGWQLYNNALSPAPTLDTIVSGGKYGTRVARLTNSTDTTGDMGLVTIVGTSSPAVEVGKTYTLSGYGQPSGSGGNFRVHINWYTAANVLIADGGIAGSLKTGVSNVWTRSVATGVAPATAAKAQCYAFVVNPANGFVFYFDAFQFEEGDVPTAYAPRVDEILPGVITSTEIADLSIINGDIANTTIAAGKLVADTLTANEIAANAITTTELNADAVTSAKIAANTIVAADIAALTITAAEIAANTITAAKIAAGTITAAEISAGAITATKLSVKFGISNLVINASLADWPSTDTPQNFLKYDNGGTGGPFTWSKVAAGGPFARNSWRLQATAKTANKGFMTAQQYDFLPNKTYVFSIYWKGDQPPATPATNMAQPTDVTVTAIDNPTVSATAWQRYSWRYVRTATTGVAGGDDKDWLYTYVTAATFDVQYAMPQFEEGDYPSAWTPKVDEQLPDTITATEIAPGTITTNEIAATTIVAGNIAAATITGTQIAATTIAAGNVATDTLTANQIATNAITTNEILAQTILAGDIATDTLTANEIAANAITSSEIAANTIVAGDIAADTITAAELAANSITASELAANSITAADMLANTITATQIAASTITTTQIAANTIVAGDIAAGTITGTEIAAGTITASKLNVTTLDAITADMGTLTAGIISGVVITGSTIKTADSGARVVMDITGLTAYDAAEIASVVIPVTGPASFRGALNADGGLSQDAVITSPPASTRKHAWLDVNEAEIAAIYGAASGFPGTATPRLFASATAPMSYGSLIKAHANIVHHWRLNGPTTPSPDSVTTNPLALGPSVGILGQAATGLISGTDGAIKSQTNGTFNYGAAPGSAENVTTGLSIEYWFRLDSLPGVDTRLMNRSTSYDGSTAEYWKSTYIASTGKLRFSILIGGVAKTITGGTTIAIGQTYHVVHTYDGANIRTYLNGVSDATAVAQTGSIDAQGTVNYRLGRLLAVTTENQNLLPTTTGQGGYAGGGGAWANTANVVSSNDTYATASVTAGGSTDFLYVGGFGFNIPTGAIITNYNILVEHHASINGVSTAPYVHLRPTYNSTTGQSTGINLGGLSIPSTDTSVNWGIAASSWSITLTPAQINSANFGVAIIYFDANGLAYTLSVDRIQVTITYYMPLTMDEAAVYNAALTTGVITDHYQTGTTGISTSVATVNRQIVGADGTSDFMPGTVTSLPGSPYDGQEIFYLADSTNGVVWHLKYRSASASAYKWEFIGGSSLVGRADVVRTLTNQTTYANLPTDPISVSLPALAGDYDITIEGDIGLTSPGFNNVYLSYAVGATAASDNWAANIALTGTGASLVKTTRHTAVAASSAIAEKGRTTGNFAGNYAFRRLIIRPVRVG